MEREGDKVEGRRWGGKRGGGRMDREGEREKVEREGRVEEKVGGEGGG